MLARITNSIYPPTHRHGVGVHILKRRGTRAGRLHRIWHGKPLLCSEAVPSLPPTLPKQMEEDIHTISTVGNVTIGLLNAQSSVKKAILINDLIIEKSLDIMIITETWLHEGGDEPAIREMTPTVYVFFQKPRSTGQRGGGLAVIYRSALTVRLCNDVDYSSFECINFVISQGKQTVRTIVIYRPPPSTAYQIKESSFHEDFGKLVSSIKNKSLLILGDFNFHWDDPGNTHTRQLKQLFDSADLTQHVSNPTHRAGHILDWVVSRSNIPAFVHYVSVEDLLLSDHFLVRLKTNMKRPVAGRKKIKTRNLKNIDMYSFRESLAKSDLVKSQSSDPEKLVLLYNQTLSILLDDYAPVTEKLVSDRPDSYWYSPLVRKAS